MEHYPERLSYPLPLRLSYAYVNEEEFKKGALILKNLIIKMRK